MSQPIRLPRSAILLLASLVLAACGGDATAPALPPVASITMTAPDGDWYEGDVAALRAIVKDAGGVPIPGAPVRWSVSDASRAEVASDGTTTFLVPGTVTVTATSGTHSVQRHFDVRRLSVLTVTVLPPAFVLAPGDVAVLGVRLQGEGGRDVTGRSVTIASDDPSIARVDAAGRLRAIAPGTVTVRAIAEGVSGTVRVEVAGDEATLSLSRVGAGRLPLLTDADTVVWNGAREYHEVFIEGGRLILTGGNTPRYRIDVRYAQYHVTGPIGARTYTLRAAWREQDYGVVHHDARGDLRMTSEYVSPLQHTAIPVPDGMQVRYRIPGDDVHLDLLYRRD